MRFALLFVFALVGCGPRPTMMPACWYEGTKISYGGCPSPFVLVFEVLPIPVSYEGGPHESSVREAVRFWNRGVGFEMFRLAPAGRVEIVYGASGRGAAGTSHEMRAGKLYATITLRDGGTIRQAYLMIAHELGHAAGLAHDYRGSRSIMAPDIASELEWSLPLVAEEDRKILRGIYLRP